MGNVMLGRPLVRARRRSFQRQRPTEGWTGGLEVVFTFFRLGNVQQLIVRPTGQIELDAPFGTVPAF